MTDARLLLDGLRFPESTRWHDRRYWVADWHAREIIAFDAAGTRERVVPVPSSPCSFDWTQEGRLLVVSGGEAVLLVEEDDGALVPYADLSPLSGPPWNEIAVEGRGHVYVNAIGFAFPGVPPPGPRAPGVVALVTPDRAVRLVADDLAFPNGMAVTADGSTLLVAESWARRLTAFDIEPDGRLSGRRVWADLDGFPDGLCLDAEGAVWVADVPNRRCVLVREGGEVTDTLAFDRGCFSCMLGGPDRRTLAVALNVWEGGAETRSDPVARGQVVAVDVSVPGRVPSG